MIQVDLNCDMGESSRLNAYSLEKDLAIMQYVSSVNLACGYHAGDSHTMHRLVEAALERNIAVGAHPSFPDRDNFGRTAMQLSPGSVYDIMLYQIGALQAFLQVYHARLHHIKPHGALYNMAAKDRTLANAICQAIKDYDDKLFVYALAGSELSQAAGDHGLQAIEEAFADRTYQQDGTLTPRTEPGALIEDTGACLRQVLQLLEQGTVYTKDNVIIALKADTVCIHGDGAHAEAFAAAIFQSLKQHHVIIRQP